MAKRKAAEALERKAASTQQPQVIPLSQAYVRHCQPTLNPAQNALCQSGTCVHCLTCFQCQTARDLKWRYDVTFGHLQAQADKGKKAEQTSPASNRLGKLEADLKALQSRVQKLESADTSLPTLLGTLQDDPIRRDSAYQSGEASGEDGPRVKRERLERQDQDADDDTTETDEDEPSESEVVVNTTQETSPSRRTAAYVYIPQSEQQQQRAWNAVNAPQEVRRSEPREATLRTPRASVEKTARSRSWTEDEIGKVKKGIRKGYNPTKILLKYKLDRTAKSIEHCVHRLKQKKTASKAG